MSNNYQTRNSLGNSLGDCPHWVKSERKWRKVRGFGNVL